MKQFQNYLYRFPIKLAATQHLIYILILLAISLWSIWPVITHFTTHIPETYDGLLYVWIINQTIDKIPFHLQDIFQGNIFFPYQDVKAYSDLFVPSALLSYIPIKLTSSPIVAFNFPFVVAQITIPLICYFWFFDISKNRTPSLIASLAFSLSQIRFHYFGHLHTWALEWFLLSSWMLWRYAILRNVKYLYLASFFFIVQMWESLFPAVWIVIVFVILLPKLIQNVKKEIAHIIRIFVITMVAISPVLILYFNFFKEFHSQRSIRDAAHFAMSVNDLWGVFWSPGIYALILISLIPYLISVNWWSFPRRRESNKQKYFSIVKSVNWIPVYTGMTKEIKFFLILTGISFILSLGPVLNWSHHTVKLFGTIFIPLPYGVLYYLVPGFGAFRTPSRFIWLFAFALGGITAIGLSKLRLSPLITCLLFLIAITGGTNLKTVYAIPRQSEYPPVYSWLKSQPDDVILELPMYSFSDPHGQREVYRMLYSLDHKKKLVNGYSGFGPPDWDTLIGELGTHFPNTELEQKLNEKRVDYIIVHKDEYEEEKVKEIEAWGNTKSVWEDEKTIVYKR